MLRSVSPARSIGIRSGALSALAFAASLASGCSGDDEPPAVEATGSQGFADGAPASTSGTTSSDGPTDSPFDGTWVSECINRSEEGGIVQPVVIDGTDAVFLTRSFNDGDCAIVDLEFRIEARLDFGAELDLADGSDALEVDIVFGDVFLVTLNEPSALAEFNDFAYCGKTDWALGEPVDVGTAFPGGCDLGETAGTVVRDIVAVERMNGNAVLLFGVPADETGGGVSDRPTRLDRSFPYVRR